MAEDISKAELVAASKDQPQNAADQTGPDESYGCLTVFR